MVAKFSWVKSYLPLTFKRHNRDLEMLCIIRHRNGTIFVCPTSESGNEPAEISLYRVNEAKPFLVAQFVRFISLFTHLSHEVQMKMIMMFLKHPSDDS